MSRYLCLILVLVGCGSVAPRTPASCKAEADIGIVVGSTGVVVGTVVAVDPTHVVDTRQERHIRAAVVGGAALVALTGLAIGHDAYMCTEEAEK